MGPDVARMLLTSPIHHRFEPEGVVAHRGWNRTTCVLEATCIIVWAPRRVGTLPSVQTRGQDGLCIGPRSFPASGPMKASKGQRRRVKR
jgi:hypothetical protein